MPDKKLGDLITEKLKLLETNPEKFITGMDKLSQKAFKDILKELKTLSLDADGNIILNNKNLSFIEEAGDKLRKIIYNNGYSGLIKEFSSGMDDVKKVTDDILKRIETFKPEKIYEDLYEVTKSNALDTLAEGAVNSQVSTFKSIIQDSIATSDNFAQLVENIQDNIIGNPGVEGKMVSYAKQNATDAFSITERTYSTVVAESMGIEFYSYSGGKQDTTRKFCSDRKDKIFHINEIRGWADESWAGKNRNTTDANITSLLGGYHCGHSLIPVGILDVPTSVIKRNLESGNIKKEDLPQSVISRL